MNTLEKSRIRLRHWIDHNADHLEGYREVAKVLDTEGAGEAAARIRKGIELMEHADEELEAALKLLPEHEASHGTVPVQHDHTHTDVHDHSHSHHHSHKEHSD